MEVYNLRVILHGYSKLSQLKAGNTTIQFTQEQLAGDFYNDKFRHIRLLVILSSHKF